MIKHTHKKILLIAVVILIISTAGVFVARAADIGYIFQVGIPGIVRAGEKLEVKGLGNLVNKVITLAYRIAMLFVLYKIIDIGFRYMTSKGNADIVATVSKGMKNVLVGILILFGSFIILKTINPDLTRIPNNINCKPGEICDGSTTTNITEDKVACPLPGGVKEVDNRTADDLENGTSSGGSTTTGDGITSDDIDEYVKANSRSFYNDHDWVVALGDLESGRTSSAIWDAIKKLVNNKSAWLDTTSCSGALYFGPIKKGHMIPSGQTYVSCHDSYEAIDLVVFDRTGSKDSDIAQTCMRAALKHINNPANGFAVTACDETNCSDVTPHIHIYDKKCKVGGCKTCP